ncbi:MAG: hypothetical protein KAI70_06130, partial [Candidatus Omnitrophica bacterium]|nr:hypothetical protein [Candidatus Omnitrophota bacterium]
LITNLSLGASLLNKTELGALDNRFFVNTAIASLRKTNKVSIFLKNVGVSKEFIGNLERINDTAVTDLFRKILSERSGSVDYSDVEQNSLGFILQAAQMKASPGNERELSDVMSSLGIVSDRERILEVFAVISNRAKGHEVINAVADILVDKAGSFDLKNEGKYIDRIVAAAVLRTNNVDVFAGVLKDFVNNDVLEDIKAKGLHAEVAEILLTPDKNGDLIKSSGDQQKINNGIAKYLMQSAKTVEDMQQSAEKFFGKRVSKRFNAIIETMKGTSEFDNFCEMIQKSLLVTNNLTNLEHMQWMERLALACNANKLETLKAAGLLLTEEVDAVRQWRKRHGEGDRNDWMDVAENVTGLGVAPSQTFVEKVLKRLTPDRLSSTAGVLGAKDASIESIAEKLVEVMSEVDIFTKKARMALLDKVLGSKHLNIRMEMSVGYKEGITDEKSLEKSAGMEKLAVRKFLARQIRIVAEVETIFKELQYSENITDGTRQVMGDTLRHAAKQKDKLLAIELFKDLGASRLREVMEDSEGRISKMYINTADKRYISTFVRKEHIKTSDVNRYLESGKDAEVLSEIEKFGEQKDKRARMEKLYEKVYGRTAKQRAFKKSGKTAEVVGDIGLIREAFRTYDMELLKELSKKIGVTGLPVGIAAKVIFAIRGFRANNSDLQGQLVLMEKVHKKLLKSIREEKKK